MNTVYNPLDWFWLAEDGRVYSSAKPGLVPASDKGFKAFKESGAVPTPWPRDEAGAESDGALDNVLQPYGLSIAGPISAPPRLTFLEFMNLFTDAEQTAIATAAMADAATKLWYDRALGASFIALDDARLGDGLQALIDAGLIGPERRTRVLAGLPPDA